MTKIIADTTCGLPLSELARLEIDVIPQIIIFDEESYRDVAIPIGLLENA